jgi:hypothetical protein
VRSDARSAAAVRAQALRVQREKEVAQQRTYARKARRARVPWRVTTPFDFLRLR